MSTQQYQAPSTGQPSQSTILFGLDTEDDFMCWDFDEIPKPVQSLPQQQQQQQQPVTNTSDDDVSLNFSMSPEEVEKLMHNYDAFMTSKVPLEEDFIAGATTTTTPTTTTHFPAPTATATSAAPMERPEPPSTSNKRRVPTCYELLDIASICDREQQQPPQEHKQAAQSTPITAAVEQPPASDEFRPEWINAMRWAEQQFRAEAYDQEGYVREFRAQDLADEQGEAQHFLNTFGLVVINMEEEEEQQQQQEEEGQQQQQQQQQGEGDSSLEGPLQAAERDVRAMLQLSTTLEDDPQSTCMASRRVREFAIKKAKREAAKANRTGDDAVFYPVWNMQGKLGGFCLPKDAAPPDWWQWEVATAAGKMDFHKEWQGREALLDPLSQAESMWQLREHAALAFTKLYGCDEIVTPVEPAVLVYGQHGHTNRSNTLYMGDLPVHWQADVLERTENGERSAYLGFVAISDEASCVRVCVGQHLVARDMFAVAAETAEATRPSLLQFKRTGEAFVNSEHVYDGMNGHSVAIPMRRGRLLIWNALCMQSFDFPSGPRAPQQGWDMGLLVHYRPLARCHPALLAAQRHAYQHGYRVPCSSMAYKQCWLTRPARYTVPSHQVAEARALMAQRDAELLDGGRLVPGTRRAHILGCQMSLLADGAAAAATTTPGATDVAPCFLYRQMGTFRNRCRRSADLDVFLQKNPETARLLHGRCFKEMSSGHLAAGGGAPPAAAKRKRRDRSSDGNEKGKEDKARRRSKKTRRRSKKARLPQANPAPPAIAAPSTPGAAPDGDAVDLLSLLLTDCAPDSEVAGALCVVHRALSVASSSSSSSNGDGDTEDVFTPEMLDCDAHLADFSPLFQQSLNLMRLAGSVPPVQRVAWRAPNNVAGGGHGGEHDDGDCSIWDMVDNPSVASRIVPAFVSATPPAPAHAPAHASAHASAPAPSRPAPLSRLKEEKDDPHCIFCGPTVTGTMRVPRRNCPTCGKRTRRRRPKSKTPCPGCWHTKHGQRQLYDSENAPIHAPYRGVYVCASCNEAHCCGARSSSRLDQPPPQHHHRE